ncbi:hypothetical protein JCM10914A_56070 [Paenibacillus sp. JCM 10914]|uniref:hypothetical protein n=1 Tax=Paenibacillus sp. JCM 10914 TaxID=1236974 RepID=UPI0003CC6D0B|nr:hypothetical protein [Paenibacillus sp. JCM 10914]GAE09595.1 hypothetical protein JCM10914_5963 [Paenibacillus sp. JCM 10914]
MKNRLMKKIMKRVSEGQQTGCEIPFFYVSKASDIAAQYFDRQYLTVFRPWWYDRFDYWSKLDFGKEWNRHFAESEREFEEKWGIDIRRLNADYRSRKRVQPRKPRKPKAGLPIRRLRDPEVFKVQMINGITRDVIGEKAFEYRGHQFFIYHNGAGWCVSCVLSGIRVSFRESYKKAVREAKDRIIKSFDSYLKQLESIKER